MIKCNACNTELNDDAIFCCNCGQKLVKNKTCPNCNAVCDNSVKFCSQCGFNFTAVSTSVAEEPASAAVEPVASGMTSGIDQEKIIADQARGIVFDGTTLVKYPEKLSDSSYEVPVGITRIGEQAFYRCENLRSISLPATITELGREAFEACYKLASINLPDSIKKIGRRCFSSCRSLDNITLPQEIENWDTNTFCHCTALTSVTIPSGIFSIPFGTFYDCKNLSSVTMHDEIDQIGEYAFAGTALKSVKLPKGIKTIPHIIDRPPFADCEKMTVIYIHKQSVLTKESVKKLLPKRSIFNQVSIEYYN